MTFPAVDVPRLFDALMRSDPARPRLTWYGESGERIELSARVLGNWVAKSANLLVEEFDAGSGTTVGLDLPPGHWKTLAIGLAVSATGATLTEVSGDVTFADQPPADVVVALASLARRFDGDVGSALDYAAVITGYDDVFLPSSPDTTLLKAARDAFQPADGDRWLVTDAEPAPLLRLVSVLLVDGSLVVAPSTEDLPRIAAQEGAEVQRHL